MTTQPSLSSAKYGSKKFSEPVYESEELYDSPQIKPKPSKKRKNKEAIKINGNASSLTDSTTSDTSKEDKHHHQVLQNKQKNFQIKKKTELCKTYQLGLVCPYGAKCSFAHGDEELRAKVLVPSNYKTTKCHQFFEKDFCNFGPRCQFLHCEPSAEPPSLKIDTSGVQINYKQVFKGVLNSFQEKKNKGGISSPTKNSNGIKNSGSVFRLPIFKNCSLIS